MHRSRKPATETSATEDLPRKIETARRPCRARRTASKQVTGRSARVVVIKEIVRTQRPEIGRAVLFNDKILSGRVACLTVRVDDEERITCICSRIRREQHRMIGGQLRGAQIAPKEQLRGPVPIAQMH